MYLIAIIITIIIPPLGVPLGLIGVNQDLAHWKHYAFCMALTFSTMGYCYETLGNSDIVRYFEYIELLKDATFYDVIRTGSYGISGESLVVFNYACWFAAKLNDPHIIPAISIFVVYYTCFYITCRIGFDYSIKRYQIVLCLVFLMMCLNFFSLVNNIRNVMAFSLIGLAGFLDIYEKKRNIMTLILYIIPLFIHTSAVLLILLRVILFFAGKLGVFSFIIVFFSRPILEYLYPVAVSLNTTRLKMIGQMIIKAYYYFIDTSSSWGLESQQSGSLQLLKFIYISITILICLIVYYMIKKKNEFVEKAVTQNTSVNSIDKTLVFMQYIFFIGLMAIACIPMLTPGYWRFSATVIIFSGCVLLPFSKMKEKNLVRYPFWILLFILGGVSMALWVRSIVIGGSTLSTFLSPYVSSPIIVLVNDFFNIV